MTRAQQTTWIVGTILAAAILLTWIMWPAPNLDGMHPVDKCDYSSYYKNRGGSVPACKEIEYRNAADRLMRGY